MELEAGLYLVSNVHNGHTRDDATPVFAATLGRLDFRETQWNQIKRVRADGRLCDVFASLAHYSRWRQFRKERAAGLPRCEDCAISDELLLARLSGLDAANTDRV
jgi:hypothetical protein